MELMNSGQNYPVWEYLLKNSHLVAAKEVLENNLFKKKAPVGGILKWKGGAFATSAEKEDEIDTKTLDDFKPWSIGIPMVKHGLVSLIIYPSWIAFMAVLNILCCCRLRDYAKGKL